MSIHITPAMNAVWAYAEWCCDHRKPWPKMTVVAADLARNECEVRLAFVGLERLGVLSRRGTGCMQGVVRLGDGRETAPVIHVIHNTAERQKCAITEPAIGVGKRRKAA